MEDGDLHPENVRKIAESLSVSQEEVISMNRRMGGGDSSLNVLVNTNNEGTLEWQDWIEDENSDHATKFADQDELNSRKKLLEGALTTLNQRECEILTKRRLMDNPLTLEELSGEYSVSRERIRQIEVRAFEKLQKKMCELAQQESVI